MKRAGKVVAPLVRRAQRLAAAQKRFASGGAVMNPSEADLYAGGMLTGVCSQLVMTASTDPKLALRHLCTFSVPEGILRASPALVPRGPGPHEARSH